MATPWADADTIGGARAGRGCLVAVTAAHGGAGATTAATALVMDAERGACLIDVDLCGNTELVASLGIAERAADAGLAGVRDAAAGFSSLARRTPFGWFVGISPRPELAWLIRDGAVRDVLRQALEHAALVVVDCGRPVGPACEAVADADVVVLVFHADRVDALAVARRRLTRLGVEDLRIIEVPTAPTIIERVIGRLRGSGTCVDLTRGDELMLLVEGRFAVVGSRGRG